MVLILMLFAIGIGNVWGALTEEYSYTFTANQFSDNTTAKTLGAITWTPATSWSNGSGYWGYDATKGQQWGSGSHTLNTMTLTAGSSISNIKKITINASIASSGGCTLSVQVGSTTIGTSKTLTTTATPYDFESATGLSGQVKITLSNGSKKKAQYIKSITIYTEAPSGCDKSVTLATGDPTNGTISFSPTGPVETCDGSVNVTMTITPNAGYYLSAYSKSGVNTSNTPSITTGTSATAAQTPTLTFGQDTNGTYTAGATFTALVDHFIDNIQETSGFTGAGKAKSGDYSGSLAELTLSDGDKTTGSNCRKGHYHFAGWVTEANASAPEGEIETLDGHATGTTYYAVWEREAAGGGVASTETVTWSDRYDEQTNVEGTALTVETNVTVTHNKGTNNTACQYYTTGPGIRVYGGGNFVVGAPSAITAITLTFGTGDGSNAITADVGTYSDGSWTGNAATVTFSVGGTSGHRRIAGISVTYGGGTSYEDPLTSCSADPVDPTATFNNGSYTIDGAALDLRTLWTSNSSGAVTYSVTDANGTGATIAGNGYSFSATTAGTCTVQASQAAVADEYNAITKTATITVNQPTCATPTFSPGAGTYTSTQSVTINCATTSAAIHYTTDGSAPTASSPTYSSAISVSEDMTIRAFATKTNYENSAEASAAYKILDCDWYESFDGTNGTGGNDGQWSGSIATADITADDSHSWTTTNGKGAYQCIKLGTGDAAGSATTPVLTGLTGSLILTFRAAGWSGESTAVSITSTSGTVSPTSVDVTSEEWNSYEVAIVNVTNAPQITFSASAGKKHRFFLDDVCVKQGSIAYHVTYNSNGASSGSVPEDNTDYAYNDDVTVLGNPNNLAKTGWTFAGWNTAADGSGTPYTAGNTIEDITGDVTLYAMWTCTVTWSVNENTSACTPETVTYNPSGNKVETVPSPDPSNYCGDVFVGWYTEEDYDSNTAPDADDIFTNVAGSPNITGNVTFYAVFADYAAE